MFVFYLFDPDNPRSINKVSLPLEFLLFDEENNGKYMPKEKEEVEGFEGQPPMDFDIARFDELFDRG